MGEERNLFEGLGWRAEIVCLVEPHISFNPLSEPGVNSSKRYLDDYEMNLFLQSTQAWK